MKEKVLTHEEMALYLRASPAWFMKNIFGYIIAEHHAKILEHFSNTQVSLDLAPRGSGKSRVGNVGYVAWVVANNPDARVLILSDTDMHAVRFLSTIKNVLSSSPVIAEYYGNLVGNQWSDHQITTSLRINKAITEASVTALGQYSGGVTTGHYTHIIADDLDNFANTRTPGMRARSKTYWKTTVLPTLLPGGEIRCLATRYHFDDLNAMFTTQLGYDTQVQPAILDSGGPNERSIWEEFMPLHTKTIHGVTVKGLIEIRDGVAGTKDSGIGSLIFDLQYQNNVELMKKSGIFKWDWFQFYDSIPSDLEIFQGVDLAISKRDTADFFVVLTIGIDNEGHVYVLDIYRERGASFARQIKIVLKKATEWAPLKIGMETNGYQIALLQEVERLSLLPVIEITTTKDKILRAQFRSGLAEAGRILVRPGMHEFVSELVLIDEGSGHDDQFDALDFALTVAVDPETEILSQEFFVPDFNFGTL